MPSPITSSHTPPPSPIIPIISTNAREYGGVQQRMATNTETNLNYDVMQTFDNGTVMTCDQIREARLRQGFCVECRGQPVRLFKVKKARYNPLWSTSEALTVKGESLHGQCLVCHPGLNPDRPRRKKRRGTVPREHTRTSTLVPSPETRSGALEPRHRRDVQSVMNLSNINTMQTSRSSRLPVDTFAEVSQRSSSSPLFSSLPGTPSPANLLQSINPRSRLADLLSSTDAVDVMSIPNITTCTRQETTDAVGPEFTEESSEDEDNMEIMFDRCRRTSSGRLTRQSSIASIMPPPSDNSPLFNRFHRNSRARETNDSGRSSRNFIVPSNDSDDPFLIPPEERSTTPTQSPPPTPTNDAAIESELATLIKDVASVGDADITTDILIFAMRDHRDSVLVQLFCLGTIWDLCKDSDHYKSSIISTSAPDDILLCMKQHMNNAVIQERACGAMWSMSGTQRNRTIITRAGAPARLVKCVVDHLENEHVIRTAVGCLRTLSPESEARESLRALQGAKHVCDAMAAHRSVASIQRDGCAFLSNSAVDLDKQQVALCHGYEFRAIVEAMAAHMNDPSVMSGACFSLKNITYEECNLRKLCRQDNVVNLLENASQYAESADCRRDASIVLERVQNCKTEDDNLENHIVTSMTEDSANGNAGAVESVLEVMREHEWSTKVTAAAFHCLATFANEGPQHRNQISDQVLKKSVFKMTKMVGSGPVIINACELLEIMARDNSSCRVAIIEAGACKTIVEATRKHLEDVNVQIAATGVLKALSKEFECWFELQQSGGDNPITEILAAHPDALLVQQNGSDIMTNFSVYA